MKPDQERICNLVTETVIKLCASGLRGSRARVEGVIGVTVDDSEVFIIHINETSSLSATETDTTPRPPRATPDHSVMLMPSECPSSRKRVRHRLQFQSPDASQRGQCRAVETCERQGVNSHVDVCSLTPPLANTEAAVTNLKKTSVVVVDSDEEDVKVIMDSDDSAVLPVHDSKVVAMDTEICDTNVNLCITNVVGSVPFPASNQQVQRPHQTAGMRANMQATAICTYQSVDNNNKAVIMKSIGSCQQLQSKLSSSQDLTSPCAQRSVSSRAANTPTRRASLCSTPTRSPGTAQLHGSQTHRSPLVVAQCRDPLVTQSRSPATTSASYKVVYMCNIGDCHSGFAYKKNLQTHQRTKHS